MAVVKLVLYICRMRRRPFMLNGRSDNRSRLKPKKSSRPNPRLQKINMSALAHKLMSFEDYLTYNDETDNRYEVVEFKGTQPIVSPTFKELVVTPENILNV